MASPPAAPSGHPREGGLLGALRSGAWLRPGRVRAYCRIFLLMDVLAVILLAATASGPLDQWQRPLGTDFISFYAAGRLAASDRPADAYSPERHEAAEREVGAFAPDLYYAFYYPPPFLLLCRLLAVPPYLVALALWIGGGATLYALAIRAIPPDRAALLPALAFPACLLCAGHGQTAFLTAALFGGGTLLVDRRPGLAGGCFGLLCLKPHLALLVPVALIAGRRWRAAAAAAAVAASLALAATLAFGTDIWPAYAKIVPEAQAGFAAGRVEFWKMASVFGAARLLGVGAGTAGLLQFAAAVAAAVVVVILWSGRASAGLRNAGLIAGSLAASPLLLDYDLVAVAVAVAWMCTDSRRFGFLEWEKSLLALLFVMPLISRPAGSLAPIPLAALVLPTLLVLVILHFIRAREVAR
ncbi:MAG TPA: glycosyltransferase family 87 protein [Stellaceae bacterium]|nr:glycosyltransferase family 87 protein [Stellaceae bacterium]